jgi:transcriptional regulator with XRE-family HTH domain
MSRAGVSSIEKGRNFPSIESILSINEHFNVNVNWLLTGDQPKYHTQDPDAQVDHLTHILQKEGVDASNINIPLNLEGSSNIVLVDARYMDSYPSHLNDPDFFKRLPSFNIPYRKFKGGKFRAFEAMETTDTPGIAEGSLVIGKAVDGWEDGSDLTEGASCVIVTTAGLRIRKIEKLAESFMVCKPEHHHGKAERINIGAIHEMWTVTAILTFDATEYVSKHLVEETNNRLAKLEKKLDAYSHIWNTAKEGIEHPSTGKKGKKKLKRKDEETDRQ